MVANLTEIAKGLDIPVLLLCQLNRGVEGRQDKLPTLNDLRDSGEIEEEADNIVFMHSKDYYDKDNPTNVWDVDLWIDKFRNGASHQCIQLRFNLVRQWFDGRKTINPNDRQYCDEKG